MAKATYPDCQYVSLDEDSMLGPGVCASVTALSFADATFDAVFCRPVLEQFPYHLFIAAIHELQGVVCRRVVISLPDESWFFFIRARGLRRVLPGSWQGTSIPYLFPEPHDYEAHGQHY